MSRQRTLCIPPSSLQTRIQKFLERLRNSIIIPLVFAVGLKQRILANRIDAVANVDDPEFGSRMFAQQCGSAISDLLLVTALIPTSERMFTCSKTKRKQIMYLQVRFQGFRIVKLGSRNKNFGRNLGLWLWGYRSSKTVRGIITSFCGLSRSVLRVV